MSNEIHIIQPRRTEFGLWVFDDPAVGLLNEPFVNDMSEIIDELTAAIPDAANGFVALFSARRFRGAAIEFTHVISDACGGTTYRCEQTHTEGWLCPALFRYFRQAPAKLYAQFLPRGSKLNNTNNRKSHETNQAKIPSNARSGTAAHV